MTTLNRLFVRTLFGLSKERFDLKKKTIIKHDPAFFQPANQEVNSSPKDKEIEAKKNRPAPDFSTHHLQNNDKLIKSVRFDELGFNNLFILGITKSPKNQIKENLRPRPHKEFTATARGPVKRSEKPPSYAPLSPTKIKSKKRKRSTIQSTSLVTPGTCTLVFGSNKSRNTKLAGYLFDPDDALINRIFLSDHGTIARPYESHTYEDALAYYNRVSDPKSPRLFPSLENFKQYIAQSNNFSTNSNEILARLRWNIKTSAVCIFSDTFESRCIAQLYAIQLLARLKEQYKELGKPWNDYEIPILYYLPDNNKKNWTKYTKEQQAQDRQEANLIFNDKERREKAFAEDNAEFLLLVNNSEKILTIQYQNMPLLQYFLYKGKFQFIDALCHLAGLSNEKDLVTFFDQTLEIKELPLIDKEGNTALHVAASIGRLSSLELLTPFDINKRNNERETPLLLAIKNHRLDAVKLLLNDERVNVNLADKNRHTILTHAAQNGYVELVRTLLNHPQLKERAINKCCFYSGGTALLFAAENGHIEIVKLLLEDKRVDINLTGERNYTVLMHAAKLGNIELVRTVLNHPQLKDYAINEYSLDCGSTALLLAAKNGHAEIVKLLLEDIRVNINLADKQYYTLLMHAAKNGNVELVQLLLNHPQLKDYTINEYSLDCGSTALLLAAKNDHAEIVKLLLADMRVNINLTDKQNYTLLMHAAKNGNVELVQLLLNHPQLEQRTINKHYIDCRTTALFFAIENDHLEIVKLLLNDKRVFVDLVYNKNQTLLVYAAQNGKVELIQLLLNHPQLDDLAINLRFNQSNTALFYAIENDHIEIAKLLLNDTRVCITDGGIWGLNYEAYKGNEDLILAFENHKQLTTPSLRYNL